MVYALLSQPLFLVEDDDRRAFTLRSTSVRMGFNSMNDLNIVQQFSIWMLPVLLGITVHEVAHGWMAKRLGDPTAFMLGRLTLNPIKHIDPIGTVLVPFVLLLIGSSFLLGWAKPVPVNFKNLRRPKIDMALVAAAGPASNLFMAILWAGLIKIAYLLSSGDVTSLTVRPLIFMGFAGISINSVLMVLNLLPIPPLDGGRILIGLLPEPLAGWLARIEAYGMILLLILLNTMIFGQVIAPLVNLVQETIMSAILI
ncbi:Site-2 protease family protein [Gammaproteobacteria bacterium]